MIFIILYEVKLEEKYNNNSSLSIITAFLTQPIYFYIIYYFIASNLELVQMLKSKDITLHKEII